MKLIQHWAREGGGHEHSGTLGRDFLEGETGFSREVDRERKGVPGPQGNRKESA